MDSPGIHPTDIMAIVNDAWQHSFARIKFYKKAISDRDWGALNYNLLHDKDIEATMKDSETHEYLSMLKSQPADQWTISDLMDENIKSTTKTIPLNFDPKYLTKVITDSVTHSPISNFSTGRAADVARRLIHDHDVRKARAANQKLASKGKKLGKSLKMLKSSQPCLTSILLVVKSEKTP